MTKKQERHIVASIGTLLFLAIVFLLLWLIKLHAYQPEQEEGIEVAFGEVEEAGGYMAEQSEAVPLPAPEPAAPDVASAPSDNDLMTSEDEETLALRKAAEEAEKARKQAEAEQQRKAREEQARLEAERKAREAAEKERKAKEAAEIAKANSLIGGLGFGNTGNTSGSGDTVGNGNKGNPAGHGNVGGNSWSLAGRDVKGEFPVPEKGKYVPGKVVIEIRVNPQGQVVSARETTGGNISDPATVEAMLKKAREVRFTPLNQLQDQIGYITYIIPD